ncbi:hypothetical protein RYZ26_17980 [Terasakiella sp. A23]|uniref:hypothetical protein n=1 Tax=Terasakiella sp. FCG-A23 TaxID=3080561 RepID=UPI00295437ED|nr:hypothetical protein [Terasakiella sp. A23]MDV7341504.1 hypothetical protein [Terasakiella sp. A23]
MVFDGVSTSDVKKYFQQLTGQPLPKAVKLPPIRNKTTGEMQEGGIRYTIKTPEGNFNLRDTSASASQTGAKWTIDVPSTAIGRKGKGSEIKFR